MTPQAERQMELTLPMVPDIEIAAARAAGNLGREIGMSAEDVDEMAHAVVEACINAREHSYCVDQRIYLRFRGSSPDVQTLKVEVWITDNGQGFNLEEARLRRRGLSNTGPKKRGWGLQIMEAHMDEVEISTSENGTTVRMVKYGERKKL